MSDPGGRAIEGPLKLNQVAALRLHIAKASHPHDHGEPGCPTTPTEHLGQPTVGQTRLHFPSQPIEIRIRGHRLAIKQRINDIRICQFEAHGTAVNPDGGPLQSFSRAPQIMFKPVLEPGKYSRRPVRQDCPRGTRNHQGQSLAQFSSTPNHI